MAYKNNPKAKRYFWLKLKNDFFEQKEIKLLRRVAGGDTYTIIYLKMMLKSLKNDGKLFYEFFGDNFDEEIALDIDESPEDVAMTIRYLESKGLIELIEGDEYFLNKVPEMLGSEAYSTARSRRHREKKKIQNNSKKLQCNNEALQKNERATDCNEEIEIELELEKSHSYSKKDDDEKNFSDLRPIYAYYENNGFGSITPKTMTDFQYWVDDFVKSGVNETDAIELIIYALGKAIDNNVRKYSYVNSILKDYENKRYRSVDQIKADEQKIASNNSKYADTSNWKVAEEDF
ncbi:phage replisome organizer N-terminal domain-containing protein [Enterococcus innesii]|uniref:phage replisome organizer N-terminal domain-containing protein n=1 Tax=Enterococcus innesii TaxID=2839759 RepID=UPI003984F475